MSSQDATEHELDVLLAKAGANVPPLLIVTVVTPPSALLAPPALALRTPPLMVRLVRLV
jgi:hypothetical protein